MKEASLLNHTWTALFCLVVTVLVVSMPTLAFAVDSEMGDVICNAAYLFTGNAGKGLATIGISVLGVGALLGKISWGLSIVVGVGIALVFNASNLVTAISGVGDCYYS